jgi:hypothetical protein
MKKEKVNILIQFISTMVKKFLVYRIIDIEDGYGTHQFEFQDYFADEENALTFIEQATDFTGGLYLCFPCYSKS